MHRGSFAQCSAAQQWQQSYLPSLGWQRSSQLWHFYLAIGMTSAIAVCMAVGPAYVMDVVPRASAALGVSLFQAAFWAGNIAGPVALGFAFERFGTAAPILASVLFPIAGVVLLMLIRGPREVQVPPGGGSGIPAGAGGR